MRAANVLSTLAAITALAAPAVAQVSKSSSANAPPSSSSNKAASSPGVSSVSSPAPMPTFAAKSSSSASAQSTPTPTPTPSSSNTPKITGGSSDTDAGPTGLPTLTKNVIPTYPAPSVPPTRNAPFMQQSSAPDGTVFIAVGSILGAFGLGILLWRSIVSLLLHRSVRQAALAQHDANGKAGFPAPPPAFHKYIDWASPTGPPASRNSRRSNRGPSVPSGTPSQSNLFFSPTAAGSNPGAGARGSTFLPSGFYAAGSSSPGGQLGPSISLTNLRPDSMIHGNGSRITLGPSPPDSPRFSPRRDMSPSSVNLNSRQPGQRAPSAYLEDLLADEPGILPLQQMPPSSGRRSSNPGGSASPLGRF